MVRLKPELIFETVPGAASGNWRAFAVCHGRKAAAEERLKTAAVFGRSPNFTDKVPS